MRTKLDRDTINLHYADGYQAAVEDAAATAARGELSPLTSDDLLHTQQVWSEGSSNIAGVPFALFGYLEGWTQSLERASGMAPRDGYRALQERMERGMERLQGYTDVIQIDPPDFAVVAQAALLCHEW
ncbi:hypothetical protein [Rhodococcus pyridinivorans]|uniref:hypothetical protein n=1 Tax=Rhodococcus pyridinivorans TaxID=103816 RepID=UPI00265ADC53|nr:hypothetical protein [Rhodococcus pyridinivorans]